VKFCGRLLYYASNEMKSNKNIVLLAMKTFPKAF
jgi:hypothetical protein